jgi:hypothetical protein
MTTTAPSRDTTAEQARLAQATAPAEDSLFEANPWYEWGPYLSERGDNGAVLGAMHQTAGPPSSLICCSTHHAGCAG